MPASSIPTVTTSNPGAPPAMPMPGQGMMPPMGMMPVPGMMPQWGGGAMPGYPQQGASMAPPPPAMMTREEVEEKRQNEVPM